MSQSCNQIKREGITLIAIVGDIHDLWDNNDVIALNHISPDITIFVGDIGNQNINLVSKIAKIAQNKAIILGNHDAFFPPRNKQKNWPKSFIEENKNKTEEDLVIKATKAQLEILGNDHIGYASKKFPETFITTVGTKPFSTTKETRNKYFKEIYNINNINDSILKIKEVIEKIPKEEDLIIVGHNGPAGLGDQQEDICGIDFLSEAGDIGDVDLKIVLNEMKENKKTPILVTFGHMHEKLKLKPAKKRKRVVYDSDNRILYLNTAVVPRVIKNGNARNKSKHHFCIVKIKEHQVIEAKDIWIEIKNNLYNGIEEKILFKYVENGNTAQINLYDNYESQWIEKNVPI